MIDKPATDAPATTTTTTSATTNTTTTEAAETTATEPATAVEDAKTTTQEEASAPEPANNKIKKSTVDKTRSELESFAKESTGSEWVEAPVSGTFEQLESGLVALTA